MWFDTTDLKRNLLIFKREAKYLASLEVDNKLILFHIRETKVDYFVERKIKTLNM